MSEVDLHAFRRRLLDLGLSYRDDDLSYLWEVAKRCAKTSGASLGAAAGLMSAGAGAVAVPGVGAVPAWILGFLAGAATGTVTCTVVHGSLKRELDKIVREK